jgi:hypothetical protein
MDGTPTRDDQTRGLLKAIDDAHGFASGGRAFRFSRTGPMLTVTGIEGGQSYYVPIPENKVMNRLGRLWIPLDRALVEDTLCDFYTRPALNGVRKHRLVN